MKKQIFTFVLAVLVLGGVVVAGAWTSAPSNPPSNNVAAPINVGTNNQRKLGSLILNADTSSPDEYGLDVFGKSRFFGKVTSKEDFCIESDAVNVCLSDLRNVNGNDYALNTEAKCDLYYDGMGGGAKEIRLWETPTAPISTACTSANGCVIKQEIYHYTKGLYKSSMVEYSQDKATGIWTSTVNKIAGLTNGNKISHNIATQWGGKKTGLIMLRDDAPKVTLASGVNKGKVYEEISADKFSFYDSSPYYGQKVYFCTNVITLEQIGEDDPEEE